MRSFRAGLAVVALAAGCNSTAVEDSNEAPAIEESALPQFVAEAQCDQQMSCDCYVEAGPVGEDPAEYTHDKCVENRVLELTHWQGRMLGSGLRYDSACAARKLAMAQEWGCGDSVDAAEIEFGREDCALRCRVYHGDVPADGECEPTIDDCAQGLVCRMQEYDPITGEPAYRCVSRCLAEGMPCTQGECAPGLFCRYSYVDETGRCEAMPVAGQSCVDSTCGSSTYCNEANVCTAVLEDGAACDFTVPCRYSCINNVCEPGPAQVCSWDLRNP